MKQKTTLFGENERHLEILKGFFHVINFLRTIKVSEPTIETIESLVQQTYYKYGNFDFPFKLLPNNILNVDGTKIALYPVGLNAGSTSFDLSSMYNSDGFQLDGLTSTLSNSGDPTLMAISTGLELLDGMGLDFETNINNVLTYGLSSWGASTNPDQSTAKFNQDAVPYIQNLLQDLTATNIEANINEAEKYLTFLIALETHKLRDHSNAKSTKLGRQVIIDLATKLRKDTVRNLLTELKSKGATINTTQLRENNAQITYKWSPTDNSFHGDGGYNYNSYKILVPVQQPATQIPTNNNQLPTTNQQQPTNSNDTMLKVAGVGALAWFIIPKLMKN